MFEPGEENDEKTMQTSIIICAYTEERWDELNAAVESVRRQTVLPLEIILVIDHNPALFARVNETFAAGSTSGQPVAPAIQVVENRQARGLSGARNTGIAVARGDILAFMDEDAVAEPDWLEWLLSGYAEPRVLGVGGVILPWWLEGQPGWFPEEFNWVVGCTYRGMPETRAPLRNLIGANMSFRREVFERVGGFVNGMGRIGTLPVGCEETELCIRAAQQTPRGIFLYEPRAVVHHRVPPARARWQYFFRRCYSEGISKALVTRLVGSRQGLSNERAYTFRTLPQGVLRSIQQAFSEHNPGLLGRGAFIAAGLMVTTLGYLRGALSMRKPPQLLQPSGKPTASQGGG